MYTDDLHVKTGNIFLKEILFGLMKNQSFPWMYNLWTSVPLHDPVKSKEFQ